MNMQTRRKPYRRYFFDWRREPDWIRMVKILIMMIGLCVVLFAFITWRMPLPDEALTFRNGATELTTFEIEERNWLITKGWFFLSAPVGIIILYYCFKDKETW